MELYLNATSPYARLVRIVLLEKGLMNAVTLKWCDPWADDEMVQGAASTAQIDGFVAVRYLTRLGDQQVHGLSLGSIAAEGAPGGSLIEAGKADDHQTGPAHLGLKPGAVEIGIDPGPDPLHHQARRLALDMGDALDPQYAVQGQGGFDAGGDLGGISGAAQFHHEAFEIVVVVVFLGGRTARRAVRER